VFDIVIFTLYIFELYIFKSYEKSYKKVVKHRSI